MESTKFDSAYYARPSLPKEETNGQNTSLHEGMTSGVYFKASLMTRFLKSSNKLISSLHVCVVIIIQNIICENTT